MEGWIKLHRKLLNSNMFKTLNSKQKTIFLTVLLLANHQENEWEWEGKVYKCGAGEFITSLASLAKFCGNDIKVQSVRTALLKLEKWHFLTNKSTKTGRLISIVNWDKYQHEEEGTNNQPNKELTKHQQRANKELTTNKNVKNVKNDKKERRHSSIKSLKKEELGEIAKRYGVSYSFVSSKKEDMENYCAAKGKVYKDYNAALCNWVKKDAPPKKQEVIPYIPMTEKISEEERENNLLRIKELKQKFNVL